MGFESGDEVENGAGSETAFADGTVGEDAEILVVVAEVEEDAGSGGQAGRGENGDVRLFR